MLAHVVVQVRRPLYVFQRDPGARVPSETAEVAGMVPTRDKYVAPDRIPDSDPGLAHRAATVIHLDLHHRVVDALRCTWHAADILKCDLRQPNIRASNIRQREFQQRGARMNI